MKLTSLMILAVVALPIPAFASGDRGSFIEDLWSDANARGIDRSVFDRALLGYTPIPEVTRQAASQPELAEGVGQYVAKRVEPRVERGKALRAEWSRTLSELEQRYGVSGEVLVAIWGLETNFGSFMGGENAVHALATLTERRYRTEYFREELLTALAIIQDGHVKAEDMVGSWAGAMGQTQFMPTSFTSFAVDFNGDGRMDIWNSVPDALASAANYLKSNGWRPGETWGYEVSIPDSFDFAAVRSQTLSLEQWQELGVRRVAGRMFPRPSDQAELYLPSGAQGPAFLTLPNFAVIKRYNNSNSYALSVGHLADRILGGSDFVTAWPNRAELTRSERMQLQRRLQQLGFDVGEIDGVVGSSTRAAVASYQARIGLPADGYPTPELLQQMVQQ